MDGVPGDAEVSLLDHITEFRSRLIIVVLTLCTAAAIAYPFSGILIRMIWGDLLPEGTQMTVYAPLELIITKMTISFVIAFVVGMPLLMFDQKLSLWTRACELHPTQKHPRAERSYPNTEEVYRREDPPQKQDP